MLLFLFAMFAMSSLALVNVLYLVSRKYALFVTPVLHNVSAHFRNSLKLIYLFVKGAMSALVPAFVFRFAYVIFFVSSCIWLLFLCIYQGASLM